MWCWRIFRLWNCKFRKRLIEKLVEEFSENIDGSTVIYNKTLNDYENVPNCCTIYIVLFVIFFIMSIRISSAFIYFHWYSKKDISKQQFIKHVNEKNLTN